MLSFLWFDRKKPLYFHHSAALPIEGLFSHGVMCGWTGLKSSRYDNSHSCAAGTSLYQTGQRSELAHNDRDHSQRPQTQHIKRQIFKELYTTVKQSSTPAISQCLNLTQTQIRSLPWNIQRAITEIRTHAADYLQAVAHFIKTHTLKAGKILSFRYLEVACITKGKVGKDKEFGRVYQLGRIGGNFLIVLPSTSVRQEDKASLIPMVKEHQNIFGENVLDSLGTDKGYFTKANVRALRGKVKKLGIQCPGNVKVQDHVPQALKDRRAGIEPLIGHAKKFGLGKSKATSDTATLASGYHSVFAFNLHQLTRYLSGKVKKATT
jgi:hypothetical protein